MLMFNFRTNVSEAFGDVFPFSRFSQASYHPSCLHARLLILAHFMTSGIPQMLRVLSGRVLPVTHLKVLISAVLSRHLVMIVSALVFNGTSY